MLKTVVVLNIFEETDTFL